MGVIEFHVPHVSVNGVTAGNRAGSCSTGPTTSCSYLDPYIYSGKEPEGAEPEYNARAFAKAREVAVHLRELLEAMSLQAFVKQPARRACMCSPRSNARSVPSRRATSAGWSASI